LFAIFAGKFALRNATFATLIRSRDDWNLVKIDWFACNYTSKSRAAVG
jgi:hypothetical protein